MVVSNDRIAGHQQSVLELLISYLFLLWTHAFMRLNFRALVPHELLSNLYSYLLLYGKEGDR